MKTTFRQNDFYPQSRRSKKLKFLLPGVFFLIIAIFIFRNTDIESPINGLVMKSVRPLLALRNGVFNFAVQSRAYFDGQALLLGKIKKLEAEGEALKAKLLDYDLVTGQNEELKSLFSRNMPDRKYILAGVLSSPPQAPYDMLILDGGREDGVTYGVGVTAYGTILLGYVEEVYESTSKVKLISFPGLETKVFFESSDIAGIALGKGGGNFLMELPSSLPVKTGDIVATPGISPLTVGIVEKVEIDLANPFQKIFFRFPVNIQNLQYVMILRS